jgi:hypothetical protein
VRAEDEIKYPSLFGEEEERGQLFLSLPSVLSMPSMN